jgi:hypothetical protein
MAADDADWAQCGHDGCIGVQLPTTALCLAHASQRASEAFDTELKRIGDEGIIDARGVQLSAELLRHLLDAAPREDGRLALKIPRRK